ncbi:cobalamin-independent methionine synthase II family protein [Streptomyces polyrhachis]|uniref:Cobalamin-independent methionine synthase II family protein n=1 Tax=Streptomyces polyrhachis TaxID=1282885 RepID=A0ABW2GHY9_9ACTN
MGKPDEQTTGPAEVDSGRRHFLKSAGYAAVATGAVAMGGLGAAAEAAADGRRPKKPAEKVVVPTEPIGSIPRPAHLIQANRDFAAGRITRRELDQHREQALRDTIERFIETGSPVITDGEQSKPSFATYPVAGLRLNPGGQVVPFADGHTRQLPLLTEGDFRYQAHGADYLRETRAVLKTIRSKAELPVKQAVIAPSMLSMFYPPLGIRGYSRAQFHEDLVNEAEADVRGSLDAGAHKVQMDFTEGRVSLKLDPDGGMLREFVSLNNEVLDRFTPEERQRIGVHTCPGGDQDSTHSADVDYARFLPRFFDLHAGNFYLQMASERDRRSVLALVREHIKPNQRVFVGVTDPITSRVETPEEVRDRVLEAAEFIPLGQLGTCDDCGFAPFADDKSTPRDTAFAKIRARVLGTRMAAERLGA